MQPENSIGAIHIDILDTSVLYMIKRMPAASDSAETEGAACSWTRTTPEQSPFAAGKSLLRAATDRQWNGLEALCRENPTWVLLGPEQDET